MEKSEVKQEIKDTKGRVIATKVSCNGDKRCNDASETECVCIDEKKAGPAIEVKESPRSEKIAAAPRPRVGIMETAFRDAHQSIMATRLRTDDMLPICEIMDEVGYHSVEMWGGATFDSAMRFLHGTGCARSKSG